MLFNQILKEGVIIIRGHTVIIILSAGGVVAVNWEPLNDF